MGGATKPSTKLVKTPPPASLYPKISNQYQGMLQTMGPQIGQTLGEAMQTGLPTDVGPAFQALQMARQRGHQQGQSNILEAYGASGNRYGSGVQTALSDYELQSQKDLTQILSDYTRQASEAAAGRRLGAAQFGGAVLGEAATTTYPTAALATGASPVSQVTQAGGGALSMLLALGVI